jgi:arsenate reductase
MKATIWHNPRCSKSRAALERLQQAGYDVAVIEYLKHPPSSATLARLYRAAGISPAHGLRLTGTDAAARGLPQAGDAAVLEAMAADPALIERPLVETPKGVRLCRPAELIEQIL